MSWAYPALIHKSSGAKRERLFQVALQAKVLVDFHSSHLSLNLNVPPKIAGPKYPMPNLGLRKGARWKTKIMEIVRCVKIAQSLRFELVRLVRRTGGGSTILYRVMSKTKNSSSGED